MNFPNIRHLSIEEIKKFFSEKNEKPFRATQMYEWLWKKSARSYDEMTNLPRAIRTLLSENFSFPVVTIASSQTSKDGTIKNIFKLSDGNIIEGVLIPAQGRITACVSSQVGCSLNCTFCATGRLKRIRNLTPDEIYDQVVLIQKQAEKKYGSTLTHIVYMGMGEPLLNYTNVLNSIEKITSPDGLGMSPQRITVSSAGIARMIKKLGDEKVKFNFALSLHAANDEKRNKIMPINKQNSLSSLAEALSYFYQKTKTRITYEYILFNDFNDSLADAKELETFCRIVPCKVNIIEYNPIENSRFCQTNRSQMNKFIAYLESRKVIVNVRQSRGKDIHAACGQLAGLSPALFKKSELG